MGCVGREINIYREDLMWPIGLREVMGVGPSGAVHMHALSRQCLVFIDDDFAYALDRRNLNIK